MDRKVHVVLLAVLYSAAGCSKSTQSNFEQFPTELESLSSARAMMAYQPEVLLSPKAVPAVLIPSEPEPFFPEIEIPNDPEVNRFVSDYFNKRKTCLARYRERRQAYGQVVERVFRRSGLPEDLIHLAMIESAFLPNARSGRGAVGMWQFIAGTARRYGLRIGSGIDDRRDIEKASEAAAKHLIDLYERFNDWSLALAAYNSGEGTVIRAIERSGSRDFFTMARSGLFPRETREYVARFMAVALIHRDVTPYTTPNEEVLQVARN